MHIFNLVVQKDLPHRVPSTFVPIKHDFPGSKTSIDLPIINSHHVVLENPSCSDNLTFFTDHKFCFLEVVIVLMFCKLLIEETDIGSNLVMLFAQYFLLASFNSILPLHNLFAHSTGQ